ANGIITTQKECEVKNEYEDNETRLLRTNPQLAGPLGDLFFKGIKKIDTEPYRKVEVQGCYDTTQDNVELILWDCGIEDNDTVSIYLNGNWIIENYRLTKAKKSFPITLQKGENYLVMYAHNLGDIPKNTAALA